MDINGIFPAHLCAYLPDSLKEWGGLDIAHGAAYLGDNDVGVGLLAHTVHLVLYLIGDVWDHLNGAAEIVTPSFLVENGPVNLSCGNIGVDGKIFVNKSLVVTQVKVCFGAVVGNEDLAVLIGGHCSGVNVYIGVEFLKSYLVSPLL